MSGDEERKWSSIGKESHCIDRSNNCINSFTLEGSPDNSSIPNCELGQTTPRQDASFRNIERVHDCDDEISARTCALDIFEQSCRNKFMHVFGKEGWMQGDLPLEIVKEKHRIDGDMGRLFVCVFVIRLRFERGRLVVEARVNEFE